MIRESTIGIIATLVLANAGNTPGPPGIRESAVSLQAWQRAGAAHRARAESALITGPQSALRLFPSDRRTRPVSSNDQQLLRAGLSVEFPRVSKFVVIAFIAAGIAAVLEIVSRFRRRSDSGLPLVLTPARNGKRPIAPAAWQSRPTGSSASAAVKPVDNPESREVVSVSAPPEQTLVLLPGRFEIVGGNDRKKEIRFVKVPGTGVVTFGRHPGETYTHVRVDSPTVSRRHASMRYAGSGWLIRNLSTTNPVVLNGKRLLVADSEHELHDGDRVEMGEVTFRFWLH